MQIIDRIKILDRSDEMVNAKGPWTTGQWKGNNLAAVLYTIGHSNHEENAFCDLLKQHDIQVLADVRSQPYSRYLPHFNAKELPIALQNHGIRYLFIGDQLGGRPDGDEFYDDEGYVLYHRVAESDFFNSGVERILKGIESWRVAIMCSEEDPGVCHRFLLVTRVLEQRGVEIRHIRGDGSLATEQQIRQQSKDDRDQGTLFEEMRNDTWKSLQSVLRDPQQNASSDE